MQKLTIPVVGKIIKYILVCFPLCQVIYARLIFLCGLNSTSSSPARTDFVLPFDLVVPFVLGLYNVPTEGSITFGLSMVLLCTAYAETCEMFEQRCVDKM